MKYKILINLVVTLSFIATSSAFCMESARATKLPKALPCKNQKKPHDYDPFVIQFENPSNTTQSKPLKKMESGQMFVWHYDAKKTKKSKSINECRRKEGACALLAIRECTCHLKTDDHSSPN